MRICPHRIGEEIEFSDSTDPNALWAATTWTQITDGRVTLASSNDHALGSTGGAETVTLTTDQIPSHTHNECINGNGADGWDHNFGAMVSAPASGGNYAGYMAQLLGWSGSSSKRVTTESTGGGQAHNNMQPWRAVNRWKRVA